MSKKITKAHVCAAIAAAQAHPENICARSLARDGYQNRVPTDSPEATCFCILGLVAKEVGMSTDSTNDVLWKLEEDMSFSKKDVTDVFLANDKGVHEGDPLRGARLLKSLL